ncbi:MAG: NAD-dependent epimerase/dehydratase family protein [Chthoniobacterales bacterium]
MILLLSGSTGFVGRNLLLKALQDPSWSQIILPVRNRDKFFKQLEKEKIIIDTERLHLCNAEKNQWHLPSSLVPDVALHCAGLTFSQERDPYFETNVEGTLNLFKKLPEKTGLLVLSSQAAAGPTPEKINLRNRSHAEEPISWYGQSKLIMEKKLLMLAKERLLILRPPMILGPRDTATVPLFKMARSFVRMKPGFRTKIYSWIDVGDLCEAILIAAKADWRKLPYQYYFLSSHQTITDRELLNTAAKAIGARGITLPLPHAAIQLLSALIYKIPALHQPLQSLGRDRLKEIIPRRWIMDGSDFERDFNWKPTTTLEESLKQAAVWIELSSL